MNRKLLLGTYIFKDLTESELDGALSYLNAREKRYKKGENLIIQGDKIIGAVTHVFVNDSTKGYGIYIENMLEHN